MTYDGQADDEFHRDPNRPTYNPTRVCKYCGLSDPSAILTEETEDGFQCIRSGACGFRITTKANGGRLPL